MTAVALSPASDRYRHDRSQFRAFVDEFVAPHADEFDRAQSIPADLLRAVAQQGYWGAVLPSEVGGAGMDMVTLGELHEEIGRGCSSLRSLLTVHTMASAMTHRWGSAATRARWLSPMASGDALAAFCLSEPDAGSDPSSITTRARKVDGGYLIDGVKRWITGGQIADLLLVFAVTDRGPTAFLIPARTPGIERTPIDDLLGTRAGMAAEIRFTDCRVPADTVIAAEGAGLLVATSALDLGRFSVASGSVGILQACLEASVAHTASRRQGGAVLREHQLVRGLISDMMSQLAAARLLCRNAAELKDRGDPSTVIATFIAKYVASTSAMRAAGDAVQLLGAHGCSTGSSVSRYFRDAKIMEIIEGSNQIQQLTIAEDAYRQGADDLAYAALGCVDMTEMVTAVDALADVSTRRGKIKCVVWDLDNTLWDGVLLEDGEVSLRNEVVEVIRALDERGILHSVASRNDPDAAMSQIEKFGLADFFLFPQVSWNSKSASVARIAKDLNIGIDTIAFVDDQPFELGEVAFEHPQVICVPVDRVGDLLELPAFTPTFLTNESKVRREMYRSAIRRDEAEQVFDGDNRAFLATLGMVLRITTAGEQDLQRAEELTIRTNQLNSTGVTYSYAELDGFRTSPDHLLLVAGLDDRFGSYGTIGLALVETGQPVWQLKLLLMSCRVMSRGVGGVLLNEIVRMAAARADGLEAAFAETGRNRTMYVTYRFAGFTEARRDGDTAVLQADLTRVADVPDYLTLIMPDPLR